MLEQGENKNNIIYLLLLNSVDVLEQGENKNNIIYLYLFNVSVDLREKQETY